MTEAPRGIEPGEAALAEALRCLRVGDWDGAHTLVQQLDGPDAARVHAHLHRMEGDLGNAAYWYRLARREAATGPLEEERNAIVTELARPS